MIVSEYVELTVTTRGMRHTQAMIGQMFYHLKYRNTNPQTLELFLTGLETGRKIHVYNMLSLSKEYSLLNYFNIYKVYIKGV